MMRRQENKQTVFNCPMSWRNLVASLFLTKIGGCLGNETSLFLGKWTSSPPARNHTDCRGEWRRCRANSRGCYTHKVNFTVILFRTPVENPLHYLKHLKDSYFYVSQAAVSTNQEKIYWDFTNTHLKNKVSHISCKHLWKVSKLIHKINISICFNVCFKVST